MYGTKDLAFTTLHYGRKPVFVFDDHSVALLPWAMLRKCSRVPLVLLTLDGHADTNGAFGHAAALLHGDNENAKTDTQLSWLRVIDFRDPDTILNALPRIQHDEHISVAVNSGIHGVALVVSQQDVATDYSLEHLEYRDRPMIEMPARPHHYRDPAQRVFHLNVQDILEAHPDAAIDSIFLSEVIEQADDMLASVGRKSLWNEPFVLDIDLDYFRTQGAFDPIDAKVFHRLLAGAMGITVAREPTCVRGINKGMSADSSFDALERHFLEALGPRSGL